MAKTTIRITFVILVIAALYTFTFHCDWIVAGPPKAQAISTEKSDGECTGLETVGRCADKCPEGDFVRGFDKETGALVCGHVTGCPYGDSIPVDSPKCAPPNPVVYNQMQPTESFVGK